VEGPQDSRPPAGLLTRYLHRSTPELARLAASGQILDMGIQVVDCVGEKDGKPRTIQYSVVGPDIKRANELIPGATSVSYGTSTPASIYAEFILEGRIAQPGVIAPELLDRAVRDEFIAELGRREMVVTRKDIRQVN
jgi:saccharopine dehydrogenase-like NADP-dependent oxidoreductase